MNNVKSFISLGLILFIIPLSADAVIITDPLSALDKVESSMYARQSYRTSDIPRSYNAYLEAIADMEKNKARLEEIKNSPSSSVEIKVQATEALKRVKNLIQPIEELVHNNNKAETILEEIARDIGWEPSFLERDRDKSSNAYWARFYAHPKYSLYKELNYKTLKSRNLLRTGLDPKSEDYFYAKRGSYDSPVKLNNIYFDLKLKMQEQEKDKLKKLTVVSADKAEQKKVPAAAAATTKMDSLSSSSDKVSVKELSTMFSSLVKIQSKAAPASKELEVADTSAKPITTGSTIGVSAIAAKFQSNSVTK